jgi:hypothetical protein
MTGAASGRDDGVVALLRPQPVLDLRDVEKFIGVRV